MGWVGLVESHSVISTIFEIALLALSGVAEIGGGEAPPWNREELRGFFVRVENAGRLGTVDAKDTELANVAGFAYRETRAAGESNDSYARRMTKKRDPSHARVKDRQWLSAVMRLFYDDASKRSDTLSRVARDRRDRVYFERMTVAAKAAADALAVNLEVSVEGLEGFMAPLPVVDGGVPPEPQGALAVVRGGVIVIEQLDRVRFLHDAPPEDAQRTAGGALREVYASQKQYNVSAEMLGHYEATWRKNFGHVRVGIPAAAPAIYLNEIALGAKEAGMRTLHLLVFSSSPKGTELRELTVALVPPPERPDRTKMSSSKANGTKTNRTKLKAGAAIEVHCSDDESMQRCAERLSRARASGPLLYVYRTDE